MDIYMKKGMINKKMQLNEQNEKNLNPLLFKNVRNSFESLKDDQNMSTIKNGSALRNFKYQIPQRKLSNCTKIHTYIDKLKKNESKKFIRNDRTSDPLYIYGDNIQLNNNFKSPNDFLQYNQNTQYNSLPFINHQRMFHDFDIVPNYKHYESYHNNDSRNIIDNMKLKDIKVCTNCGTKRTPSWRRSSTARKLLCNACGLYLKLHGRPRPFIISADGKTKALQTSFDKLWCLECNTTDLVIFHESMGGIPLCKECYEFYNNPDFILDRKSLPFRKNNHCETFDDKNMHFISDNKENDFKYKKNDNYYQYMEGNNLFEKYNEQNYNKVFHGGSSFYENAKPTNKPQKDCN
ncbi:hypothetical protein COBT_001476 [Conglomerata obtusa]